MALHFFQVLGVVTLAMLFLIAVCLAIVPWVSFVVEKYWRWCSSAQDKYK